MNDIQDKFNAIATEYDRQRPMFIPCFYDFYGIAIDNLVLENPNPRILDLGAGTGLLSSFVLQKYPTAKITLVDFSEKMLTVARERFIGNDNISFICQDITKISSEEKYDAVVSSLAIHHLTDADKQILFKRIYEILDVDGLFINAEQVEGETPYLKELNHNKWVQSVEMSGLTESEKNAGYERVKLDKRTSLSKQLMWLESIGFSDVDCLYKYYDFVVMYCKK